MKKYEAPSLEVIDIRIEEDINTSVISQGEGPIPEAANLGFFPGGF